MENQTIINAISALTASLDAMVRAKNETGAKEVGAKILELTKKLK